MVTNNLLTVTCTRDLKQMILQAHSIDVFVTTRCTHWVFIEDTETSREEWIDLLSPFYTRHTLKLVYNYLTDFDHPGWYRQQILKLYAVKLIQDDYLILDSKNFFIKSSNLDWDLVESSGLVTNIKYSIKGLFGDFQIFLKDYLDKDIGDYHYEAWSPFKARKKIVKRILKEMDLFDCFKKCIDRKIYPSEFGLYSWFTDVDLEKNNLHIDDYHKNTRFLTYWEDAHLTRPISDNIEVLGIHRDVCYIKDYKLVDLAVDLSQRGLDQQILNNGFNIKW